MSSYQYCAFYDVDETVFSFNIKESFLEFFLLETLPLESYARRLFNKFMKRNYARRLNGASEVELNKEYFKNFSGMPDKLLQEIGHSWYYKTKLERQDHFFNAKTLYEIEMHKRNNAQIILLSTSFLPCLEPFMEEIYCRSLICAELEKLNGYYTGNILSDPITVDGKAKAIEKYLKNQKKVEKKEIKSKIISHETRFCDISYDYSEDIFNRFSSERFKNLYRN